MTDIRNNVEGIIRTLNLNASFYRQSDIVSLVENPFGSVWTIVYQARESLYSEPAIFSCLANPELEDEILNGTDWLRDAGSFNPGFYSTSDGTYYEDGRSDGYDFLVKETYFHSLETGQLHVNQEFVFLFGLYLGDDGCYYTIDECGRKEMVVDVDKDVVRFRTSYLMRYIAARQMLYVQFVDSRRSSLPDYPRGVQQIDSESHKDASYHYEIWYQSTEEHDYLFSMLYARSVVYPNDVSTCRISPYDGECDEDYPEFVIEELPDGTLKRFSCKPDKLANYFRANPDAPPYLTPVFFRPEVLDQYRADPHFEVSERRLSCGTQWGIEIDNSIPERVMVYLGDLGRDLPSSERGHFRTYEISPTGQRISETAIAQDFFCSFDAPMGPVSSFFSARRQLNETWMKWFGQSLYRPPHADESDLEKLIRIPSGNGRQEFDTVILNLTKYCIDYIDESVLTTADKPGGINRLEATLRELGISIDLVPLRNLQKVRSACMAHAKGKKYEELKGSLLTGNGPRDVAKLIEQLTDMMNDLASAIRETTTESASHSNNLDACN